MTYRKLCYSYTIDNLDDKVYMAELNSENYAIRAVSIRLDDSYGYADENIYVNNGSLSDVPFPTVDEFYCSGIYDLSEADCYDITKEEFEAEWEKAAAFCKSHNIEPRSYQQ